jgi:hypothetical protein
MLDHLIALSFLEPARLWHRRSSESCNAHAISTPRINHHLDILPLVLPNRALSMLTAPHSIPGPEATT